MDVESCFNLLLKCWSFTYPPFFCFVFPYSQTTIKIFTSCLRVDIEYKTLGIQWETTARDVVRQVLRRCKMRQKDPRLFYLSMEVTIRKAGAKTLLKLEDDARPALLQACHPKGDSRWVDKTLVSIVSNFSKTTQLSFRFCLQMKPGGLVRVHTSALQPTSQYKSIVISEETTSDEVLGLLLSTLNSIEIIEQFSLYEVSTRVYPSLCSLVTRSQ